MTRQRNDEHSTEFGLWVRNQSQLDSRRMALDIQNLDFIVHRYSRDYGNERRVMLIEEKRYLSNPSFAQKDTHGIIDQALKFASDNGCKVYTARGQLVRLKYYGYHVLRFQKTSPLNGQMFWDGAVITAEQLVRILLFELDPRSFAHHKKDAS